MRISARLLSVLIIAGAVLGSIGCLRTMAPKTPKPMRAPVMGSYDGNEFKHDVENYKTSMDKEQWATAEAQRNSIAYRVMGDIEVSYGRFEIGLTERRAGVHTSADAVQLGLTAATGVVGVVDVKDMLAASATAFQGTRTSFDKNYFQEKTTEALISQMRASRQAIQARLIKNLGTRDVRSYPFEAAWIDLVQYYYAGTVPSALVELANKAGTEATQTKAEVTQAVSAVTRSAIDVRSTYESLSSAALSRDTSKSQYGTTMLRTILEDAGYAPAANATPDQLLEMFRTAMAEAADDSKKLDKLNSAIKQAQSK